MKTRPFLLSAIVTISLAAPLHAAAQQDWVGNEQQAVPQVADAPSEDASAHGDWKVLRIIQGDTVLLNVQDASGVLHLVVGRTGNRLWAVPAERSSALVSLPSLPLTISPASDDTIVYVDDDFSIILFDDGASRVWSVERGLR